MQPPLEPQETLKWIKFLWPIVSALLGLAIAPLMTTVSGLQSQVEVLQLEARELHRSLESMEHEHRRALETHNSQDPQAGKRAEAGLQEVRKCLTPLPAVARCLREGNRW